MLRRLVREAVISVSRAQQAIEDLLDLRIHTLSSFHSSSCDLAPRHNLSAYDSAYLVLAAQLGASLITRDARLATAAAGSVSAEVF